MNKNLKLFTSDQDRLAFEDSNSYERPYVSAVSGDAHFNKLITGTIENPAIGEVNVQNGDYFDRISIQKSLIIGNPPGGAFLNFLCFPFDTTVGEIREALGNYKLSQIGFASDLNMVCPIQSDGSLGWQGNSMSYTVTQYSETLLIPAGRPIFIVVNHNKQSKEIVSVTLTFKNKTIIVGNSLVSEQTRASNWYFVGNPFRCYMNASGLSTATNVLIVASGGMQRSSNIDIAKAATCSGWIEYRGPIPSER